MKKGKETTHATRSFLPSRLNTEEKRCAGKRRGVSIRECERRKRERGREGGGGKGEKEKGGWRESEMWEGKESKAAHSPHMTRTEKREKGVVVVVKRKRWWRGGEVGRERKRRKGRGGREEGGGMWMERVRALPQTRLFHFAHSACCVMKASFSFVVSPSRFPAKTSSIRSIIKGPKQSSRDA